MVTESSMKQYALTDPDVRLMLEVREDNAAAFEELVLRYQGRVRSILQHLVGDRDLADDLTQETFLRVYRSRKTYEPGAKFSTWFFTIANNVALNAMRNRSRKPEVQFGGRVPGIGDSAIENNSGADYYIQASSSMIPARALDKLEMRSVVRLAIESLNEQQRAAVLLHKFEGMSYMEIAEVMGKTPQAIKSLLCRARSNLKEIIEPYMERGTIRKIEPRDEPDDDR